MTAPNATDFPQVYEDLGIDTGHLGCIMIDTAPIEVHHVIPEDDLYYADEVAHPHTQGIVSETVPHVTLLYGLMRSGMELKKHVDAVLDGWPIPAIVIDRVSFFYGKDEVSSYITIVALVRATDGLGEGNGRLRLLPHIDTFAEYHPHITLAYVKDTANWETYVETLNAQYAGQEIMPAGLNYGSSD
jgi:2'-5' RNA ligase